MIQTVKDLITHLQDNYEPEETVAYTLYSKADVGDVREEASEIAWDSIVSDFDNAIDTAQSELNNYVETLMSEYLEEEN